MEVVTFLGLISFIILVGFVGEILFKKFSIAPVIIYILLGIIIAQLFNIDTDRAMDIAPYFGAIVFSIILFEGGLEIHFSTFLKTMGKAIMFSSLVFALTTITVTVVWFIIYQEILKGILMGIIVGCTSAAIIVPIINKLDVSKEVKTLITLESTFTDMLTIVFVFLILDFVKNGGHDVGNAFLSSLWNTLSISVVLGLVFGFIFFRMYASMKDSQLSYMLVLALMFGMYTIVEMFHGSGPLSVLIMGLIVGNAPDMFQKIKKNFRLDLYKFVKLKHEELVLDQYVHRATAELSFITRVFFFVLLGMSVNLSFLTNIWDVLFIFLIFLSIMLARFVGITFLKFQFRNLESRELRIVFFSMPRGLATAVVAFQPLIYGIKGAEIFISVAFGIILLTTLTMTLGIFFTRS